MPRRKPKITFFSGFDHVRTQKDFITPYQEQPKRRKLFDNQYAHLLTEHIFVSRLIHKDLLSFQKYYEGKKIFYRPY